MGRLSVPISSDQLRSSSLGYYVPDGTIICNGRTINSRHVDQNANNQKSRMSVHFYTGRYLLQFPVQLIFFGGFIPPVKGFIPPPEENLDFCLCTIPTVGLYGKHVEITLPHREITATYN